MLPDDSWYYCFEFILTNVPITPNKHSKKTRRVEATIIRFRRLALVSASFFNVAKRVVIALEWHRKMYGLGPCSLSGSRVLSDLSKRASAGQLIDAFVYNITRHKRGSVVLALPSYMRRSSVLRKTHEPRIAANLCDRMVSCLLGTIWRFDIDSLEISRDKDVRKIYNSILDSHIDWSLYDQENFGSHSLHIKFEITKGVVNHVNAMHYRGPMYYPGGNYISVNGPVIIPANRAILSNCVLLKIGLLPNTCVANFDRQCELQLLNIGVVMRGRLVGFDF